MDSKTTGQRTKKARGFPKAGMVVALALLVGGVLLWPQSGLANTGPATTAGFHDDFDFFTPPTEPTSPSANLAAFITTAGGTTKDFDEPASNRFVAHTFTSLPPDICKATLAIHLKAGSSNGSFNDAIHLTFVGAGPTLPPEGSQRWTRFIGTETNQDGLFPSAWQSPANETIVLDLGDLPLAAGQPDKASNLIPGMSKHGFLDFYVQDDTDVDDMTLTLKSGCAPATLGLYLKPETASTNILVKDKFTVGIRISDLNLKNTDNDGIAGYVAWQARVNYTPGLRLQQPPVFKSPLTISATAKGINTVLLGATIKAGAQETNYEGNLVNLGFQCVKPGVHTVTLKQTGETFVVSENNGKPAVAIGPKVVTVDCRAAVMSLSLKSGAKPVPASPEPAQNTFWVPQGQTFVVGVRVNDIRNFSFDEVHAKVSIGGTNVALKSVSAKAPCLSGAQYSSDKANVSISCLTDNLTVAPTGNVFNITLRCTDVSPGTVTEQVITLVAPGTGLTDKLGNEVKPFLGKPLTEPLTIHCVGAQSDKDGDGCTPHQEAQFNPPLDPNKYDYWDTNNDDIIDIRDVLAYVQNVFQEPSGKVLSTDGGTDIDLDDIINVIKLFGTNCLPIGP